MSYILDALKRADAERSQGAVLQSVGAEPSATFIPSKRTPRTRNRIWLMGLAALTLMVAAAWAWYTMGAATRESSATVAMAPEPTLAPAEVTRPAEPPPSAPAPILSPTANTQAAPAAEPEIEKPPGAPVLPILAKAPPAPRPPPTKPPAATPAAAPEEPPKAEKKPASALAALSAAQRAALPPITVSGSSYSANAAHRMLIANGQVVKEGQELSPGLLLEAIGPHSAIFNQGGTRFNVNY